MKPRRCPVHDQPSPRRIAELEADTDINPNAVGEFRESKPSFMEVFEDPDLIDCGREWCRERRAQR